MELGFYGIETSLNCRLCLTGALGKDSAGDEVVIALALVDAVGPRIVAPHQHQVAYLRYQAFPQLFIGFVFNMHTASVQFIIAPMDF